MAPVSAAAAVQQQLDSVRTDLKRTFSTETTPSTDLLAIALDKLPALARLHVLELWLASSSCSLAPSTSSDPKASLLWRLLCDANSKAQPQEGSGSTKYGIVTITPKRTAIPRKTGTLNAPYRQDGSLEMWEDTEIETRLHMKQFYGVRGEGRLFDSVCALPSFQRWSPEELRHQDYTDGRKGEAGHSSSSSSAAVASSIDGDDSAPLDLPVDVPLLMQDILKRVKHYLTFTLRPGLCASLRQVTEAATLLDSDGSVKAALERSSLRLAAGYPSNPAPSVPDDTTNGDPPAEDGDVDDMAGLGLRVRVKQSKQKQMRKQQQQQQEPQKGAAASSGAGQLAAQQAQKERDEQILKYAGFEELGSATAIRKAEQELYRRHEQALQIFVAALREKDVRSSVVQSWTTANVAQESKSTMQPVSPAKRTSNGARPPINTVVAPSDSDGRPAIVSGNSGLSMVTAATDSATDSPSVIVTHPSLRPLKAARLFECSAPDLGRWQVYFSSKACSQLRQLDRDTEEMVARKIKALSHGHFSSSNMKQLGRYDNPVYEAKCSRDLRIIYQIDLYTDAATQIQTQILKIWGINTHAQIDARLWSAVSRGQTENRSAEYRKRISSRSAVRKTVGEKVSDVIDPLQFPRLAEGATSLAVSRTPKNANTDLTEAECIELHDMLALQKWTPWSRSLLNAAIARIEDATHLFILSEAEQDVYNYDSSAFVIGRSGTGKTSCALFKLLGLEESLKNEPVRARQLFVTKSSVLATKIRDYYLRLRQTLNASSLSAGELERLAEKGRNDAIDLTDEEDVRKALPSKWSELEDSHFPLFLSFDHLCSLLEADLGIERLAASAMEEDRKRARKMMAFGAKQKKGPDGRDESGETAADAAEADEITNETQAFLLDSDDRDVVPGTAIDRSAWVHFVDADTFVQHYWQHFDEKLTKNLDALLCYAEFVGVIQGGIETLQSKNGHLTRTEYRELPHRGKANFAHVRDRIYDLFVAYRKRKAQRGDWDAAERTHAILKAMNGWSSWKLSTLFVDEAQDQLLIDTQLLRSLVSNPMGHFWAGDTAQTISASAFRFQDLSAAFFEAEQAEALVKNGARPPIQPKMFNLLVNYRSHRGITNVAASLVDMVSHFFPNSIDSLGREVGITDGTLPLVFDGFEANELQVESFLFGAGDTTMEFGAEQCIIVRDEKARTELRGKLGDDFGLILTIYESKGLEFSDVLLYNYFRDSPASEAKWRVILALLNDSSLSVPTFDLTKHSVILNELRCLYVACTRARNRLWIFDTSPRVDPIKTFLHKRNLVSLCRPGDPLPEMAVSSTPKQWSETAKTLFDRKLYKQAANCYGRAGMVHEAAIALAYEQRATARESLKANKPSKQLIAEFDRAGELLSAAAAGATRANKKKLLTEAALAYVQAANRGRAAECYEEAGELTTAARLYRKDKRYVDALRLLKGHPPPELAWLSTAVQTEPEAPVQKQVLEEREAELVLFEVRASLLKEDKLADARELFESEDHELEFMDEYGFDTASLSVLERLGQHERCAELHLATGSLLAAVAALRKADLHSRADEILMSHLLGSCPLGTNVDAFRNERTLLSGLKAALRYVSGEAKSENPLLATYRRVADPALLYKEVVRELESTSTSEQLFVLDFALQNAIDVSALDPEALESLAQATLTYASLLEPICRSNQVSDDLLKLLGCEPVLVDGQQDESRWLVRSASPIFSKLPSAAVPAEGGSIAATGALPQQISAFFAIRLFDRLQAYFGQINQLPSLRPPCLVHALTKACKDANCANLHMSSGFLDQYATRARLLALHLPFANHLAWLGDRLHAYGYQLRECWDLRRALLDKMLLALYPFKPAFGTPAMHFEHGKPLFDTAQQNRLTAESLLHLHTLTSRVDADTFLNRLAQNGLLATAFTAERFHAEFPWTQASRRNDGNVRNPENGRSLAEPLYHLLTQPKISRQLSVDVLSSANTVVRSFLQYSGKLDLNVFSHILETLTIIAIIGARQAGTSGSGFEYVTLPEYLCRQAVLQFGNTRIQMYPQPIEGLAFNLATVAHQMLGGTDGYFVDGSKVKGSLRNLVAAKFLRLLALLGFNKSNRGTNSIQDCVLREFKRINTEILAAVHRAGKHRPPTHPPFVAKYLEARNWADVATALQDSSAGQPAANQLIQLHLHSQKAANSVRGIRAVTASSLDNLARRWSGQAEVKISTYAPGGPSAVNAWTKKPAFAGLTPTQVSAKAGGKVILKPSASEPAKTESNNKAGTTVEAPPASAAPGTPAKILFDALFPEAPKPTEETESMPSSKKTETVTPVVSAITDAEQFFEMEEDAVPLQDIDFKPLEQLEDAPELTPERIAAAERIRTFLVSIKERKSKAVIKTPESVLLGELRKIALQVPPSASRHAYIDALFDEYPTIKNVIDLLLKRCDATKKRISKRIHDEFVDMEEHHTRVNKASRLRWKIFNLRKDLTASLTSGNFSKVRNILRPLGDIIKELAEMTGSTLTTGEKDTALKLCSHGGLLIEEPPAPEPTAKAPKRPILNTSEDLDDDRVDASCDEGFVGEQ